jgi:hypothetical protein
MDIATMYEKGEGVDRDEKEAKKWLDKANQTEISNNNKLKEKALKGDSKAQFEMGYRFWNQNTQKDYMEANKWFLMAAKQNNTEAIFLLGLDFERGNGVRQDEREAFNWYEKAALLGDEDGELQIGCMYLHGIGVEKNLKKAAIWFLKSARQGNVYAAYKIADIYRDDMKLGVSSDELEIYMHRGMQRGDSYDPYRPEWLELQKKFNATTIK